MKKISLLIINFQNGDPRAFEKIFYEYYDRIYHFASNLIRTEAEAKDISAESFMKLWKLRGNFESLGNIKSFLYLTTRNACFDYLRSQQTQRNAQKEILYLLNDTQEIDNAMINAELFNELGRLIENLPHMSQKVIKAIYYHKLDTSQGSALLGITTQNFLNHKNKAIESLKNSFKNISF